MQIRKNSVLGWTIHITLSALMGWFLGYMLIPGIGANIFGFVLPILIRVALGIGIGATYLFCYRNDIDTAFPFKNGGWLR